MGELRSSAGVSFDVACDVLVAGGGAAHRDQMGQHVRQVSNDRRWRAGVRDEGSGARLAGDQPLPCQPIQCTPDRDARQTMQGSEAWLARQPLAGRQRAAGDPLLEEEIQPMGLRCINCVQG